MKAITKAVWAIVVSAATAQASAEITFYQEQGFQGRSFTTEKQIGNLDRFGFNDRASSVSVENERWEICEDARYRGRCVVLRPGQYPTLAALGLNDRISSARAIGRDQRIDERRYAPTPAPAQITFYEDERFGGRSFTTDKRVEDFRRKGFNDRVSSLVVTGPYRWEACEDIRFNGRCVVLRPGEYPTLRGTDLSDRISSVRKSVTKAPAPEPAQIAFFEQEGFAGRAFTTDKSLENLRRSGFNDRASSAVVVGNRQWEVCDDARFNGRCRILRPGQYPSLAAMGLSNSISSVREIGRDARIDERRYAPAPIAAPNYRQRKDERLFEADVTSVHAVVGTPEKRCWIEREQAPQNENQVNAPGAVLGALLGGVLGHQVGGGTGKDIATAGGAIAGAVIGSRMGGNGSPQTVPQNVQRCEDLPHQARTEYWDVTYTFRGEEHRIQMASPPGRTISVNAQGEPRT